MPHQSRISYNETLVLNILSRNIKCIAILKFVNQIKDEELWIGGGFLRNIIWDYKHSYLVNTEFGDIDIFYFNKKCLDKGRDIEIENKLLEISPNIDWSVKNQARMHIHNDEEPYVSLTDALLKFPDTASTTIVRLNENNNIEFIAPYGYSDLFNLLVKPTPYYLKDQTKYQKYIDRVLRKKWENKWPMLKIYKKI